MDAIYSATALRDHPREVKEAARKGLVRITENGNGAFVFCSERVFKDQLRRVAEDAAYEARMAAVLERGRVDIDAGRVVEGTEAALAEIERRAVARG